MEEGCSKILSEIKNVLRKWDFILGIYYKSSLVQSNVIDIFSKNVPSSTSLQSKMTANLRNLGHLQTAA